MAVRYITDFPVFKTRSSLTVIMGVAPLPKKEFLDLIARKLRFPDYFGKNWDALSDSLSGLAGLKKKRIRLIFPVSPLTEKKDNEILLRILEDAQEELFDVGVTLEIEFIKEKLD